MLQKFGTDFQILESMFGGERTRLELKRKFKREEKTFKELEGKSGFGFEAYESDEARLKEEAVNSEVKSKKTKRAGPRRRYKNKGFYDSSSEEESVADRKQENLAGQSASKVSSAKRTRENLLKVPVLMQKATLPKTRTLREILETFFTSSIPLVAL